MSKRFTSLVFAAILIAASGQTAQARTAKCLLEVDGKAFIDGQCDFRPLTGKSGDFQITSADGLYFAYLYVEKGRNGTGHWNEEPGAGHAHTPLGPLTRDGACWKSDTVKLCAW